MFNYKKINEKYNLQVRDIAYIGANRGQELVDLMEVYVDSNFYLFEPQKDVFSNLVETFKSKNNLNFYNIGLGSVKQKKRLYKNTNNENMSSSVLKPKEHLHFYPHVNFEGFEEIELEKFSNLKITNVNYLNIDVQGYELEVLKGFDEYLDDVDYIFCEVNRKELYEDCVLVGELDNFLGNYHFQRIETIWYKKTIPWGDAFYIKKDKVSNYLIYRSKLFNFIQKMKGYFFIITLFKKFKIVK